MNKRSLILGGSLLAAVALGWLAVRWFNHKAEFIAAVSDKEMIKARQRLFPGSPTQPEVAPLVQLPASRKVRLAIGALGSPDDAQNANLADLLTAELTGAKGLELVERNALDRALRELELSRSGLVRAKDAVRVGKLVHADWFLLGARHHAGAADLLVLRLVDARTGILRDVTVLASGHDLTRTASEAGQFVRQCRQAASAKNAQPRLLLAIGGFADVGINNRQAAFPDQLRSYLTMAYRNSAATLLERESIAVLLEEVHLDLAGLADAETGPIPPLQSAFWLVDGCFQSYETAGLEVEVVLRISRIFGRQTTATLRGPPDDGFFRKIKDTVDAAIAKGNRQLVVPTRRSEISAEMNTGKELFAVATGGHHIDWPTPFYSAGAPSSSAQRASDLTEAMRCFQTVVALDPTNREARFAVAACLLDPSMDSLEAARNAFLELANPETEDQWATRAATALAFSYRGHGRSEAVKWLLKASQFGPQKPLAQAASNILSDYVAAEARRTGSVATQAIAAAELNLPQGIAQADKYLRGKGGHFDYSLGFEGYLDLYGTNKHAGLKRLAELLPSLIHQFPDLEPYLVECATFCQVDTNAPVVARFKQSLAACRQHPDTVFAAPAYFDSLVHSPYEWCMDNKLYALATELVETKRDAARKLPALPFPRVDQVKLAYTYVLREQWAEAEAVFEQLGDLAVDVWGPPGPWGNSHDMVLPGKAAAYCRAKLGRPEPAQRSDRFDLGKPCLSVSASTVAGSEDALWLGVPGGILRLSLDLGTNLQVSLPAEASFAPVTALALGPSAVYVGTQGAGLLEFDKATGSFRHWTQKDGLLLDQISCLRLDGQSLWIGFGTDFNAVGGLGKLDLASGRFTMFTPSITSMPTPFHPQVPGFMQYHTAADGPPRLTVQKIEVSPDLVWLISMEGIRSYQPSGGVWRSFPLPGGAHATTFLATPEEFVLGFELWGFPMPPVPLHKAPARLAGGAPPGLVLRHGAPQVFEHTYEMQSPGLALCALGPRQWSLLTENGSVLPATPDFMVSQGQDVWLTGRGYVAVFDRTRDAIRRLCPIDARWVEGLDVFGGYVWVKFNQRLYRAPLSAAQ